MATDESMAGTSHQYQRLPSASLSGSKNPRSWLWARTTAFNSTGAGSFVAFGGVLQVSGNNAAVNQGHNALVAPERRDDLPAGASLKGGKLVPFGRVIEHAPHLDRVEFDIGALVAARENFS